MSSKDWYQAGSLPERRWVCGYCGQQVANDTGYRRTDTSTMIYICPSCARPTLVEGSRMHPKGKPGRTIEHLPAEIEKIYEEARTCMSTSSYTAVAMLCRVVLFRVAKDKKIPDPTPGQSPSYAACIDHLVDNGHVAVNDKEWVDKIRVFGNEANHELADTSEEDAQQALNFVAHILTSMYEYRGPVGTP